MSTFAIVGSGIVGGIMAYRLTQAGHTVTVFEKGPAYPYPYRDPWQERYGYLYENPANQAPPDIQRATSEGISFSLDAERFMRVGGSGSVWEAISIRMMPEDFRTQTLFGYGADWPLAYDEIEPFYGQAEAIMGVSGTDADNPFAPARSTDYPLPPFELAYDDALMRDRLAAQGITLHTTPQARTRAAYDGRQACINFGTCRYCPIGARYSPTFHLQKAVDSGLCTVRTDVSVRRIHDEADGATLTIRAHHAAEDETFRADVVIVAAGALESARLLLLSDGLGNSGGWVGQGLAFHHVWKGRARYDDALYPNRIGAWSGQSLQFVNAPTRGDHAAVKVEFSSRLAYDPPMTWGTPQDFRAALAPQLHWRQILLQAEAPSSPEKHLVLSSEVDRFGDPLAHVRYAFTDLDRATYGYARSIFDQFVSATGAVQSEFPPMDYWDTGSHHMGGCRMGTSAADSVVDSFGKVHDAEHVYVVGASNFVGTSGASNPTLTVAALALRCADHLIAEESHAR